MELIEQKKEMFLVEKTVGIIKKEIGRLEDIQKARKNALES